MAKSFINGRDSFGASSLNTLKVANYNSNLSINNYADFGIHNFKPAALVYIGANPGQNNYDLLVLNKPESTFGRDNQCDHPIISVEISRKHALIKYENNRWWILDLKSTNGLMVDGKRLVAEVMTLLKDGSEIIFAPCEQCNFKFRFNEHYRPSPNSQIKPLQCFSMSNFDRHDYNFVDPSGYESVATQDINMPPSPSNMDFYRLLDFYKENHSRLLFENEKLNAQLKEKCDLNRIFSKDSDMEKRRLKHENETLEKKNSNLFSLVKKYRILLSQFEETKSQPRCALSDDESNHSVTGLNSNAVSNVLKEITCSICSEFLVCPTSLSCSHVFCSHCIDEWKREYRSKYNSASNGICPVCRKEVECQTHVLAFENVINFLLEDVLNGKEKEDRAKMLETRRQKSSSLTTFSPQQSSFSVGAILQQILNGLPRSRRSSIVITSDSDDDENSHNGHSDGDVSLVSDHSNDGSDVDIRLITEDGFDFTDSESSDEEFSRSISITLSGGNQNDISVGLALGNDSDDEILMIEDESLDDDSSNDSEDVYIGFYDLDEESHQDAIVITDSEDDQVVALPSSSRPHRRSSMIILSDSEDSLPARRNSHQNGLNSTEIITISNDEAAPDGNNSLRRNGGRSRSRRSHPYRRSGQNNNNNNNTNNQRRATLCA